VDAFLQTSAPGIFAAGDVARWPDPHTGERIRVEHWVVAQRQGQVAALNMLDERTPYEDVPFFWSAHYDVSLRYVGHAERWDRIDVDGDLERRDAAVTFSREGRRLALVTVGRDRAALEVELAMERQRL
jgi:3-phenylpropionate/trans-cinnamate dioxygenase ferredoxin reductase subunit